MKEIREAPKQTSVVVKSEVNYCRVDLANSCSGYDKEGTFLETLNDCALKQLVVELFYDHLWLLLFSGAAMFLCSCVLYFYLLWVLL